MNSLTSTIVLDASVIINILACGNAAQLLKVLDRKAVVPRQVAQEISREPALQADSTNSFKKLLQSGLLQLHELEGEHYLKFLELVGAATPDSLGDGEAATIATAEQLQCMAIIDERKATRISRNRRSSHMTACTLDLYASDHVEASFSADELTSIVFNSMRYARMRVPRDHRDWVIKLIGEDRARQCTCFPK